MTRPAEAAAALLIANGMWLRRTSFRRFIWVQEDSAIAGDSPMADIEWAKAIAALDSGEMDCPRTDAQLLRIAASIAVGEPIDLQDCLSGLDVANAQLIMAAVLHASGNAECSTE